jgi:hypothetical protein
MDAAAPAVAQPPRRAARSSVDGATPPAAPAPAPDPPRAAAPPPAGTRTRPRARARETDGPSAQESRLAGAPALATAGAPARTAAAAAAEPGPPEPDAPAEQLATTVRTELGGLFHLVRVGQLLGLYGDFTTPAAPGIALPLWDFVALLGGRLLAPRLRGRHGEVGGHRPDEPERDRVWALLAELAGRGPDEPPGRGYRPPRAWRVPPDWLEPFPDRGTWRCARGADRLTLLHPAGFAVVDAAGADLPRELRRYGGPEGSRVRMIAPAEPRDCSGEASSNRPIAASYRAPSSAREGWLGHLAAYVRARLALALGVAPRAAPRLALRRPALVHVTPTSVDVVSQLEDLPIEIRLAGLDRDPGYVPAAGRSLRFHFE